MSDYSILARKNLCRVFKLCCLVAGKPHSEFPTVDIDISGCAVPRLTVTSCVRGVQSCIAASNYRQSVLFTKNTSECVRDAIAGSRAFMADAGFDSWVNICGAEQGAFERRYLKQFTTHLA